MSCVKAQPNPSILTHLTTKNVYLVGAESRAPGSIITGWVAADRKKRSICSSSFAAAGDGGWERRWARPLFFDIDSSLDLNPLRVSLTW